MAVGNDGDGGDGDGVAAAAALTNEAAVSSDAPLKKNRDGTTAAAAAAADRLLLHRRQRLKEAAERAKQKEAKRDAILTCLRGIGVDQHRKSSIGDGQGEDEEDQDEVVNLWHLRTLALMRGGLLDPTMRRRAWTKLVGADEHILRTASIRRGSLLPLVKSTDTSRSGGGDGGDKDDDGKDNNNNDEGEGDTDDFRTDTDTDHSEGDAGDGLLSPAPLTEDDVDMIKRDVGRCAWHVEWHIRTMRRARRREERREQMELAVARRTAAAPSSETTAAAPSPPKQLRVADFLPRRDHHPPPNANAASPSSSAAVDRRSKDDGGHDHDDDEDADGGASTPRDSAWIIGSGPSTPLSMTSGMSTPPTPRAGVGIGAYSSSTSTTATTTMGVPVVRRRKKDRRRIPGSPSSSSSRGSGRTSRSSGRSASTVRRAEEQELLLSILTSVLRCRPPPPPPPPPPQSTPTQPSPTVLTSRRARFRRRRSSSSAANDTTNQDENSVLVYDDDGDDDRLHYYQGLHDVASLLLVNLESPSLASLLLRKIAYHHLRDAMRPDFRRLRAALRVSFWTILQSVDGELAGVLGEDCGVVEPTFALGWILTWYGHDVKDVDVASRLVDAFLAGHPLLPVYLAVSIVIHPSSRSRILDAATGEGRDDVDVWMALSRLLKDLLAEATVGATAARPEAAVADEADAGGGGAVVEGRSGAGEIPEEEKKERLMDMFEDLLEGAISIMRKVPPSRLLSHAESHCDGTAITRQLIQDASTAALFGPPPSWSVAATAPTDWTLIRQANAMRNSSVAVRAAARKERRAARRLQAGTAGGENRSMRARSSGPLSVVPSDEIREKYILAVNASGLGETYDAKRMSRRRVVITGSLLAAIGVAAIYFARVGLHVPSNSQCTETGVYAMLHGELGGEGNGLILNSSAESVLGCSGVDVESYASENATAQLIRRSPGARPESEVVSSRSDTGRDDSVPPGAANKRAIANEPKTGSKQDFASPLSSATKISVKHPPDRINGGFALSARNRRDDASMSHRGSAHEEQTVSTAGDSNVPSSNLDDSLQGEEDVAKTSRALAPPENTAVMIQRKGRVSRRLRKFGLFMNEMLQNDAEIIFQ